MEHELISRGPTASGAGTLKAPWPIIGPVAAFAGATVTTAMGTFGGDQKQDQVEVYPALVVFVAIATALVFAFAVRPTATQHGTGTRTMGLGVASMLTIVVFFTGLPVILGIASLTTAAVTPPSWRRTAGVASAYFALVVAVVLVFFG